MKRSKIALLGCTLAMVSVAAAAEAGRAGYGPAPAAGPASSGGFSQVLASATRSSSGGSLTARAGSTSVAVAIPAGALQSPVQLTLVGADNTRRARLPGQARASIAVRAATTAGTPIQGRISARPMTVTLKNPAVKPGDRVVGWSAAKRAFVAIPSTLVRFARGSVTIQFNRPSEFAVLAGR